MTEAEWLLCEDPLLLLRYLDTSRPPELRPPASTLNHQWDRPHVGMDRRFRLYSCLCCRSVWGHIPEEVSKEAVVAVEELLEGQRTCQETYADFIASSRVESQPDGRQRSDQGYWVVKYLGRAFYKLTAAGGAIDLSVRVRHILAANESGTLPLSAILTQQVGWIRDIFGNPFRPVTFPNSWLTEHTVGIASRMYDRDFAAMPILADALEEAGCDNADILTHCREPGTHVRGCWVVDLVLGKS